MVWTLHKHGALAHAITWKMAALSTVRLTPFAFTIVMPRHDSHDPVTFGASSTRLDQLATSCAGVRMGHALGWLDGAGAGALRDLSRHRRAGACHPFQPRLGA